MVALDKMSKAVMGAAALFTIAINSAKDAEACIGRPGPVQVQLNDEIVKLDPAKVGEKAVTPKGITIEVTDGFKFLVTKPDGSKKTLGAYGLTRSLRPEPPKCGDIYLKD